MSLGTIWYGAYTSDICKSLSSKRGPVAQLGARFHGMEEVVGSNPTRSTNLLPSIHAGFPHISTLQNLLSSGACHKVVTNRMCTDFGARRVEMGSRVENRRSDCSLPVDTRLGFRLATSVRFGLVLFPVPAHRTGRTRAPDPFAFRRAGRRMYLGDQKLGPPFGGPCFS
jgi:hypothetical protein